MSRLEDTEDLESDRTVEDLRPFTLWIDSEGGYLVLPQSRIVIGQADPSRPVDVPIAADLEAQHLVIHRDGSQFQVEPLGEVYLAGRLLTAREAFVPGDILTLGGGVQLRLERPHPLSGSVRLIIVSRHRTRPWSDGIILMSEALLVGPSQRDHVCCRTWGAGLVLHRKGSQLLARFSGSLEVEGAEGKSPIAVVPLRRIHGPDFSFCIESMSGRND